MNCAGEMSPCPGRRHRISASPPTTRPSRRSTLGWYRISELVALDGAPQLCLQHEPLDRRRAHLRREEAVAVAAVLLGVVHRRVRVADQVDDVVGVARAQGDADAAGDVELVLVQLERPAQLVEELARERADHRAVVGRRREVLDEQGKFVAGQAAQHRVARQLLVHPLGEDLERTVARGMAEGVVDLLEAVEVEVDQRELACRRGACARSPAAGSAGTGAGSGSWSACRSARGSGCGARRACVR